MAPGETCGAVKVVDATGPEPTLGDVGEDGLIASVVAVARRTPGPEWLVVGPGDDAAVLDLGGRVAVSTDTLVQGHDFLLEWSGGFDVGVKTAAQNLADVAAMGAAPRALLVSLAAPGTLPAGWAAALAEGLAEECARAGARVVGGDVSAASEIVVTGTALGAHPPGLPPVLRSGARPGDVVALAGRAGASAAGWAALRAGLGADPALAGVVAAHLRPRPPYAAGPAAAAAGATAMIDTSDGLLRDATRIASASGVVVDLDPPVPDPDLLAAARRLDLDPLTWVLAGGEDHALLACFPPATPLPAPFRPIGHVHPGPPAVLVSGHPWPGPTGWQHFT